MNVRPPPGLPARTRHGDGGFTLIEMLIALVLSAMIAGVIVAALLTSLNVARSTTDQVNDSADAGLISAFLLRDAQSSGATDPTTAQTDPTLGVSTPLYGTDWSGCEQLGKTFVVRFSWIDRPSTSPQTVVATYALDGVGQLTRRVCEGATSVDVVLASHLRSALATCEPVVCTASPTSVSLAVTGSGTRAPLLYTLKASLRRDAQTAPPPSAKSSPVPLLALGPRAAPAGCVTLSGTGVVTVIGNALVDATCGAITTDPLLVTRGGTRSSTPGIVDPFSALVAPPENCALGGANSEPLGAALNVDDVVVYPQPVTIDTDVVFLPGQYVFCDGLVVSAGHVTGTNVLLYVADGTLVVGTSATVDLKARGVDGSYPNPNLLIWVDTPQIITIDGGPRVSSYRGLIYAPTSTLQLSSVMAANIGGLVVKDLTVTGQGAARIGLPVPPLAITAMSLPAGQVAVAYTPTTATASSGTAAKWIATGLPLGLTIDRTSGVISGTPLTAGMFDVVVTMFDPTDAATSIDLTLSVAAQLTISGPASLLDGQVGVVYPPTVVTSAGGIAPKSWSWSSTTLPPGLVIDASTGTISGIPTTVGAFTVTVEVTDAMSATATIDYTFSIAAPPVTDLTGPTGGSVDAGGLVGTGSRYSTSTVLSLTLNKGTDPSGVAATGARLWRATATLTSAGGIADGACGTFGSYTLIGTDPVSPKSDPVTDQACYSYRYVVADILGNPTTYTSPSIKVDTTGPSAPALVFSAIENTYWPGAGTTVYYRSAAATGSFTTTATATDPASGIASYAFPALGANWTSTPGALGVNTYSWTSGPATPGTKNVTATNNATGASSGAPFTVTADDTAPGVGTVTYVDGIITTTSVSVSFTTGTDAGSGIATRLLQRADATLTAGSCGTFGAFATVTNGTNPTSPLVDTVSRGNCYKYQYVVSDNLGNLSTASSASVVKATWTYFDMVNGTAGLLNWWRLGEATTSSDSFTGTNNTELTTHTPEIGPRWTKHAVSKTANAVIANPGNHIRKDGNDTLGALYYIPTAPTSADYTVETDVFVASLLAADRIGVVGRLDTAGDGTYYSAGYDYQTKKWTVYIVVNGSWAALGESLIAQALTEGATYRLALDMTGATIRLLVNGTQVVSVVNPVITAPGRAGVALGFGPATTTVKNNAGMHLDNFTVTPSLADRKGTNHGAYLSGPGLGVTPGAIANDPNTAAQFDGVNDYARATRLISGDFSIELWFKSTQGIGAGAQWYSGAGLVDADVGGVTNDFGVSLRADGRIVAGVGNPDTSIMSSAGYNNGAWHHVVFTRSTVTPLSLLLYVDGILVASGTGNTAALTSPVDINIGRLANGSNYFLGSLDEIAVYDQVVPGSTVTEHYYAGT